MARTLSEQKVLKKLGIPDFRHMTKDKIVAFATMLPKMDPEVAKKALEQFPEFAKTATEIVSYYKEMIEKGFDYNDASVKSFYITCDAIIETLNEQLKDGNLTFDEKQIVIDKMIELAKMKADKDTENKHFISGILGKATVGVGIVVAAVATVLGVQTQMGKIESGENEDGNPDIIDSV